MSSVDFCPLEVRFGTLRILGVQTVGLFVLLVITGDLLASLRFPLSVGASHSAQQRKLVPLFAGICASFLRSEITDVRKVHTHERAVTLTLRPRAGRIHAHERAVRFFGPGFGPALSLGVEGDRDVLAPLSRQRVEVREVRCGGGAGHGGRRRLGDEGVGLGGGVLDVHGAEEVLEEHDVGLLLVPDVLGLALGPQQLGGARADRLQGALRLAVHEVGRQGERGRFLGQ